MFINVDLLCLCRAQHVVRGFGEEIYHALSTGETGTSLLVSQWRRNFVETYLGNVSNKRWSSPVLSPALVKLHSNIVDILDLIVLHEYVKITWLSDFFKLL